MRMRRKKWARPELEACEYFVQNPAEYKGRWKERFPNPQNPIELELGCGKGLFVSQIALENPQTNFMAIDIKSEVLAVARRNIVKMFSENGKKEDNILLMSQDIERIHDILAQEDGISKVYINFCNPWGREKHKKRRLTHIRQLEKYKTFLNKPAEIHFKTDDDGLFEDSLEYFKEAGFEISYITYDLHQSGYQPNYQTEHEKMFTEQGIKIKFLIATIN